MRVRFAADPGRRLPWSVWWNVYQPGTTGRPKEKSQWFATEAEAEEFKRLTLAALAEAPAATPVAPTTVPIHWQADALGALAPAWLEWVKEAREAATYRSYAGLVSQYLAPAPDHPRYPGLGHVLVRNDALTTKLIVDYLTGLQKAGVSLSMRRRLHRGLSALCTYASFAGRLTGVNPCANVGRMIKQRGEATSEPQPNPFTPEELEAFFDTLEATESLPVRAYFQFQYDVGTRPGEAAALKWTALDLDRQRATIARSYSPDAKADKDPKTHHVREVDLTDAVVDLLREWYPIQLQEALRRGLSRPVYVFTSRSIAHHSRELGRFKQDGNIQLIYARVAKACKITGHTLYDFRDSFATSHLVGSWDRKLAWVSRQLGHKTPLTTATFYYAYRDRRDTQGFANEIRQY